MASGGMGGGIMQIVYIIIVLWVVIEIGLPLFKKLLGEIKSAFGARMNPVSYSSYSYL